MKTFFSTAYLPNTLYFSHLLKADVIYFERHEHFQKQSYRNRTQILGANGVLNLTIPVVQRHSKEPIGETKISYAERWQARHWQSIASAYGKSPYFIYFEDAIKPFYTARFDLLLDFNCRQLETILRLLKVNRKFFFTESFCETYFNALDFRFSLHPKLPSPNILPVPVYPQMFDSKFGFTPHLSILDLLFNYGLNSKGYLLGLPTFET